MDTLIRNCEHQGSLGNMCFVCGKKLGKTGVSNIRMCESDMRIMESHKKLYLVLDLDHTLLNSTGINGMTTDEDYLKTLTLDRESLLLFTVESMELMIKLRPFVRTFLKEANEMFEMSIYTMGSRRYAREMAKLLDPEGVYFSNRIISRDDTTGRHKSLDVVSGNEEAVLIVDDTKNVWLKKHEGNLVEIKRYHFFASSCEQYKLDSKSLSELKMDENESDGALCSVLNVLKRTHRLYFDDNTSRDVRPILKQVQETGH